MERFHRLEWSERPALVDRFEDARAKAIGLLLIHLERPDLLEKSVRDEYAARMARRIAGADDDVEWLTLPQALEEVSTLLSSASESDRSFYQGHYDYLSARLEEAIQLLG